jgi:exopolyphosphatase / guanosine-5'-triphosphate,3'-diphosphate pyrophosphatase
MHVMRIGVIDVGSNTTRLLVASAGPDGLVPLDKQKVRLSLGEEIERFGAVSAVHRAAAVKAVREMATTARRNRVASLDVFLTAPGRQASNAHELVAALSRAAGVQARVLTKEEEGTLAYRGAVLTAGVELPSRIAVCDIGGASTEIAVGSPAGEPDWIESVDLGSVRLTTRAGDMRSEAEGAFAHVAPPSVEAVLAVGGSARAARRLVGAELSETTLAAALQIVETTSPGDVSRRFGVDPARTEILPAGVILLAEVQRKLGAPLHVCSGGIREGAVLASLDAAAALATSAAGSRARRPRR